MLVDANLLLYARDETSAHHPVAKDWLQDVLNGPVRVGIPWVSLVAFLRISTHPRVYDQPLRVEDAWRQVRAWMDAPATWIPAPTANHATVLERLLVDSGGTANLVSDAHLAALAIEHGLELCSADSDFARFDGLRWRNPVAR